MNKEYTYESKKGPMVLEPLDNTVSVARHSDDGVCAIDFKDHILAVGHPIDPETGEREIGAASPAVVVTDSHRDASPEELFPSYLNTKIDAVYLKTPDKQDAHDPMLELFFNARSYIGIRKRIALRKAMNRAKLFIQESTTA